MRVPALVSSLLLALPVAGQGPPSYSRFDFGNAWHLDREDAFPNARSAQGSQAGDFLYKAFPKEVFARDAEIRVSGLRLWFRVDKSYLRSFPTFVTLPEVAFLPLVSGAVGNETFDLPDRARPLARTLPLPAVSVLRGDVQMYELRLGPGQPDPRLREPVILSARDASDALQGWAVALMASPGEKAGDGEPHFIAVPTFGEIHRAGGPSTFSGMYDARLARFLPYGTTGAPSNVGELAIELLIDGPSLQVLSDAAGGVRDDPRKIETHMGPGAYRNDLASAVIAGYFGLYCQWEGGANEGVYCLPLVTAVGGALPDQRQPIGDATVLWDPARASGIAIFLATGLTGPLTLYRAGGIAGQREDQPQVYVTPRLPIAPDPALRGLTIWVQALFGRPTTLRFVAASNLVRIVF